MQNLDLYYQKLLELMINKDLFISDSHCHIQHLYKEKHINILDYLEYAYQHRINQHLNIGINLQDSQQNILNNKNLSSQYSKYKIFDSVGIHPQETSKQFFNDNIKYKQFLQFAKDNLKQYSTIGEIGLDIRYINNYHLQEILFIEQLKFAAENNFYIIIHNVFAINKITQIISKYKKIYPNLKGVIHAFSGDIKQAKKLIDLGFYLGVGGVIKHQKYAKLFSQINSKHLLLETDLPYMVNINLQNNKHPLLEVLLYLSLSYSQNIFDEKIIIDIINNTNQNFKQMLNI